ncbi:MAG: FAD-dependent oxidoreductase [Oscillospiraceae bacterium]
MRRHPRRDGGSTQGCRCVQENIAALKAAPAPKAPEYQDEVRTVDVVVCGAGAGGLAAAIEAKLAGAEVVIVEKQGITGGATARSGGKLLGAGTKWQKKQGLYDNTDMVFDYLMDVGNRNGKFMDESKNRYLVDHLNQTLDWLTSIEATVKGDPAEVLAEPWQPLSKPVERTACSRRTLTCSTSNPSTSACSRGACTTPRRRRTDQRRRRRDLHAPDAVL